MPELMSSLAVETNALPDVTWSSKIFFLLLLLLVGLSSSVETSVTFWLVVLTLVVSLSAYFALGLLNTPV